MKSLLNFINEYEKNTPIKYRRKRSERLTKTHTAVDLS